MAYLRLFDMNGNKQDVETNYIPRVGERVIMAYGAGSDPVQTHYYRVKDVLYNFDNKPDKQAAVLIAEESNPEYWPG